MHLLSLFLFLLPLVYCGCPYSEKARREKYAAALAEVDWEGVKEDLIHLFTNSQDFWPADYGNYGPFFIRQAWHCSGSYRVYDGRGGCDGGRQRFDPERSWDDNTNLDKAKTLLWPIKQKYGEGLSWGDLIILAGTTAIESMGGPVLGFCAGRIDDADGSESDLLGPTWIQNHTFPCPVEGKCQSPLGTTTIGLIYVNPEGPMGVPDPKGSSADVRDTFGRMNMNDMETVALIGGGHAFGKAHGACPNGPGPSPKQDPSNPWPGECGTGKGKDTFTSGFEGAWTTNPTAWDNSYYQELLNNNWRVHIGPGGHHQWQTVNGTKGVMMLTSDISLLNDPLGRYQKYVELFASDITLLNKAFADVWYKLVTRDMGPATRCVGPWVPPPQPFQFPLPSPPSHMPDFQKVVNSIQNLLFSNTSSILPPDAGYKSNNRSPYYGALLVHLAWQCATTFRHTDYLGGCNGARIRFPPQTEWAHNVAMDRLLELLAPIQEEYENLSWADLIVLAGTVALEEASDNRAQLSFCARRTDASDGSGSEILQPNGDFSATVGEMRARARLIGLTDRELVALSGRLRSPSQVGRIGYYGSWTMDPSTLSNEYFVTLLSETWEPYTVPSSGKGQYKAKGKNLFMLPVDLNLRWDAPFLAIAQEYASDNSLFLQEFSAAWVKLMNIDRFDGPTGNVCDN